MKMVFSRRLHRCGSDFVPCEFHDIVTDPLAHLVVKVAMNGSTTALSLIVLCILAILRMRSFKRLFGRTKKRTVYVDSLPDSK